MAVNQLIELWSGIFKTPDCRIFTSNCGFEEGMCQEEEDKDLCERWGEGCLQMYI